MNSLTKIVVFDTETTGLVVPNASITEQPYIASISWYTIWYNSASKKIVDYDETFADMQTLYCNDVIMNAAASKINGLTTEFLRQSEHSTLDVLKAFYEDTKDADVFVAHNNAYDIQLISFACIRNKYIAPYSKILKSTNICTSAHSRNYSFNDTTRYMNLRKLYKHLHGHNFDNAHTSDADVKALVKCLDKLVATNEISYSILENAKHINNNLMYLHILRQDEHCTITMCIENLATSDSSKSISMRFTDFNAVLKSIAEFADNSNVIVFSNKQQLDYFTSNVKHANKFLTRFGFTLSFVSNLHSALNATELAALHKAAKFALNASFTLIQDNGEMYS